MEKENNRKTGSAGEAAVVDFLQKNGFQIIMCNFRFGRMGEIDIIAREKEFICFIEVKSRSSLLFGYPSEAVGWKKRENIKRLAQIFIKRHKLEDSNIRFDIAEVIYQKKSNEFLLKELNLIRNAF
ncbi:MAG: YraN family protein [Bacillota bacterium]|nr:YraN family protein [Bacillota bacterium]